MYQIVICLPLLVLFFMPVGAAAESGQDGDWHTYLLEIDEHSFEIIYQIDADMLAMAVDKELDSLLIGIENAGGSMMTVSLPHDLIHAKDDSYAVLVSGFEVDYSMTEKEDTSTLSFFVPEFTEEIEIIGTHVIPEFPLGAIIILAAIAAVVVCSRVVPFSVRL